MNTTDTNQASQVRKALITATLSLRHAEIATRPGSVEDAERSFESAVRYISDFIRTEKLKLLNELDKSMPTAEQLTTKYGYHMPEKQFGYKIGLHDIREVIEAERNKLKESSDD